jgi:hypothetical protein
VAEQATGTMGGIGDSEVPTVALPGMAHAHYSGKPISWIAVIVTTIGFIVGGAGMAIVGHPVWWVFWTGVGIVVIGGIITLSAKTFAEDWY